MTRFKRRNQAQENDKRAPQKKFLTFLLDKNLFAIDISRIQEIQSLRNEVKITKILDTPGHIMGVMDFRKEIIPVVDLRIFFHLETEVPKDLNALIIIHMQQNNLGIIVDSASDIIELSFEKIKSVPDFFTLIHHDYVENIAELDAQLIVILNMEKLLSSEELQIEKPRIHDDTFQIFQ